MIEDPLPEGLHDLNIRSAQIQTQSNCNGHCVMCPYRHTRSFLPQGRMDFDLYMNIVDELTSWPSIKHISPTLQNEPLLDPRIVEAIRYIKGKRNDIHVSLSTNGLMLNLKMLETLVNTGLNSLVFSLNALTRKTFQNIEPNLNYDTVIENLRMLAEVRPPHLEVTVKAMLIRANLVEFLLPEKFSDIPNLLKAAKIPLISNAISNRAGALKGYSDMLVWEKTQSSKRKMYCHDVFENINILYNGEVIACCADWSRASILGNANEKTLQQIWQDEKAESLRERVAQGAYRKIEPCKNCSQALNILKNLEQSNT